MDKGVVVDVGNDIEGFVPVSQLNVGHAVTDPAEIAWETMKLDVRVLEVDPIHRRIVLAVTNIPEDQPPRPETPSKVIPMDSETDIGYGMPPVGEEGQAEPA
jgi:small subunit ribosomal protein S1